MHNGFVILISAVQVGNEWGYPVALNDLYTHLIYPFTCFCSHQAGNIWTLLIVINQVIWAVDGIVLQVQGDGGEVKIATGIPDINCIDN